MLNIDKSVKFLDFGCSAGSSIAAMQNKFSVTGLGIDIDDQKLELARSKGLNAVNFDLINGVVPANSVEFVTMIHVLEHLNSIDEAARFITQGVRAATKFVFIRIPNFDVDGLLIKHGVKFYHSDWSGHRLHLSSLQLYLICVRALGRRNGEVLVGGRQLLSGRCKGIVPASAPRNLSKRDAEAFPAFDLNKIGVPVHKETFALIVLGNRQGYGPKLLRRMKVNPTDIRARHSNFSDVTPDQEV